MSRSVAGLCDSCACIGQLAPVVQQAIRASGVGCHPPQTAGFPTESVSTAATAATRLVNPITSVGCVTVVSLSNGRGHMTMKSPNLVIVSTFRSTADAHIAKGILDDAGIESMIRSDNAGGMYPSLAGADLLVNADDAEKARAALQDRERR